MDAETTEKFRQILRERLDALVRASGSAVANFVVIRENHADTVDLAVDETDREFALRMQESDRVKITAVQGALKRLADGDFGDCVGCGSEIDLRRLMANPTATLCIDCAVEQEIHAGR